jgi:hypothetical protein
MFGFTMTLDGMDMSSSFRFCATLLRSRTASVELKRYHEAEVPAMRGHEVCERKDNRGKENTCGVLF